MKQKFALLAITILVAFTSCVNSQTTNPDKGSKREVSGFKSISLNVPGDVTLTKGDFSVSINASNSILEKIRTEVKGSELIIKFDNSFNFHGSEDISISISMPDLEGLEVNGSGKIKSESSFSSDDVSLEINGSGEIVLTSLTANSIDEEINGSGHIRHTGGSATSTKLEINGSGSIDAEGLQSKSVEADISGSGKMKIAVSEALDADITGSGTILYRGNPPKKTVDVTGSGSISSL